MRSLSMLRLAARAPRRSGPVTSTLGRTNQVRRESMSTAPAQVIALRPEHEVMTLQKLPYFVGISGSTVGASGLSMHVVVIPPGAKADPHIHIGYETGIYVLEGRVLTRWGDNLEHEVISEAGDFLFVPPGVPHEALNLSSQSPARAIIARNDPAEQDKVVPFQPSAA